MAPGGDTRQRPFIPHGDLFCGLLSTRMVFPPKVHLPQETITAVLQPVRKVRVQALRRQRRKMARRERNISGHCSGCSSPMGGHRLPVQVAPVPLSDSYSHRVPGITFLADATGFLWLETKQPHQFRLLLGAFKRDVGCT